MSVGRPKVAERYAALVETDEPLLLGLLALADPVRLRMVRLLAEREQCVCHLTATLGISQASVSHHVAVLKRAGLVEDRRDTRWTYYRLAPEAASLLRVAIDGLLGSSRADSTSADCCGLAEPESCGAPMAVRTPYLEAQVEPITPAEGSTPRGS